MRASRIRMSIKRVLTKCSRLQMLTRSAQNIYTHQIRVRYYARE